MVKKLSISLFFLLIAFILVTTLASVPYELLVSHGDVILSEQEFESLQKNSSGFLTGQFFSVHANSAEDRQDKLTQYDVNFKLFNLFNIKNLKVKVSTDNQVYVGGNTIGISLKGKGVVVVGSNYIITKQGNKYPFKDSGLMVGDVLTHIDGKEIDNVLVITEYLKNYSKSNRALKLTVQRKYEELEIEVVPALDAQTSEYRLGIWIRDDALGVGTLTFVDAKTKKYGSLGHAIIDADSGTKFLARGGNIYRSEVIGVKQGQKNRPGELLGLFGQSSESMLGTVEKNTDNGVYGKFDDLDFLLKNKLYEVGGRMSARPGRAKILSCISGSEVKEYDIEIIKTNYQSRPNEKSIVIKIVDKELIEKTGGIVQGMSGSPIIQDGKIIGAVTHVFINDPTKGFGLYLDWMIAEL